MFDQLRDNHTVFKPKYLSYQLRGNHTVFKLKFMHIIEVILDMSFLIQ